MYAMWSTSPGQQAWVPRWYCRLNVPRSSVTGVPVAGFPFTPGIPGVSSLAAADLDGTPGAEIAYTDAFGALHVVNVVHGSLHAADRTPVGGASLSK